MAFSRRTIFANILIIWLITTIIFLGCGKINQENYDKLKVGMDYDEVLKIIGKPDNCKSVLNMKNCIWEESSKSITIKVFANKVVFLSGHGI